MPVLVRQVSRPALSRPDRITMSYSPRLYVASTLTPSEAPPGRAKLRYLPSYSPDLNPIELLFAKLKALLRKAAERDIDALWTRIGKLLDAFTTDECGAIFVTPATLQIDPNLL